VFFADHYCSHCGSECHPSCISRDRNKCIFTIVKHPQRGRRLKKTKKKKELVRHPERDAHWQTRERCKVLIVLNAYIASQETIKAMKPTTAVDDTSDRAPLFCDPLVGLVSADEVAFPTLAGMDTVGYADPS
jgi:hypothetical protein